MFNTKENLAIETRIMKVKETESKIDGRYLQGFNSKGVTDELIIEIMDNSVFEIDTYGNNTTIVKCTLPNGFAIVETTSCVDEANYCERFGANLCMHKISEKIRELLNFTYLTAINGFNAIEEEEIKEDMSVEEKVEKAIIKAYDEILEQELGYDIKTIKKSRIYEEHKAKLEAIMQAGMKETIVELAKAEELSSKDIVELIVALHMATN